MFACNEEILLPDSDANGQDRHGELAAKPEDDLHPIRTDASTADRNRTDMDKILSFHKSRLTFPNTFILQNCYIIMRIFENVIFINKYIY